MNTLIELQVIAYMIQNQSLEMILGNGIEPEDFTGAYQEQVRFIVDHTKKYGSTPDYITMTRQFPDDFEQLNITESALCLEEQLIHHVKYNRTARIIDGVKNHLVSNNPDDFNYAIKHLVGGLDEVGSSLGGRNLGTDITQDTTRLEMYEKRLSGEIAPPVTFGLSALDESLKGILPDDVVTVFARSSHGKSYIMAILAKLLWEQGLSVLMYSGEMETMQVAYRVDTMISGLSNNALMFGNQLYNQNNEPVTLDEYKSHLERMGRADNFFRVVTPREDFHGSAPTVGDIEDLINQLKPDVVFLDQLSLMRDQDKARSTKEQYANIMRDIRLLSETKAIPIFVAAQANREATEKDEEGAYKVPEPHHIANADDVLHFSTRVIGIALNKVEDSTTHVMKVGVKKNRHAALTEFDMLIDFDKGVFEEYVAPESIEVADAENVFKQFEATGAVPGGGLGF